MKGNIFSINFETFEFLKIVRCFDSSLFSVPIQSSFKTQKFHLKPKAKLKKQDFNRKPRNSLVVLFSNKKDLLENGLKKLIFLQGNPPVLRAQ